MNLEREMVYCDTERERDRDRERMKKCILQCSCMCVYWTVKNSQVIAIGHCQGAGQEQAI